MTSRRKKYEEFRQSLSPELARIEATNDSEQFTPVFDRHCELLIENSGGGEVNSSLEQIQSQGRDRWSKNQMQIFLKERENFKNLVDRGSYVSMIKHNLGLGQGDSQRHAEFIKRLTDVHQNKIAEHKRRRESLLASKDGFPTLTQGQEIKLQQTKENTRRMVESSLKVGEGLHNLRMASKSVTKAIQDSKDFNDKIEDPSWINRRLHKQQSELDCFQ